MDSLLLFMREVYIAKPDLRLTVKEIYEDFRIWIIGKYDITTWNKISQRQVYAALKNFPEYPYVRFKEGFCLKGITYRQEKNPRKEDTVVPDTKPYLMLNIIHPQAETETLFPDISPPTEIIELVKQTNICPKIQGVILPTLGLNHPKIPIESQIRVCSTKVTK